MPTPGSRSRCPAGLKPTAGYSNDHRVCERYPGPWETEESGESVRVLAKDGTVLAYIYFEDELPTRRATGKRDTRAEAWALAKAIVGIGG